MFGACDANSPDVTQNVMQNRVISTLGIQISNIFRLILRGFANSRLYFALIRPSGSGRIERERSYAANWLLSRPAETPEF